jgi:hypothetical protein
MNVLSSRVVLRVRKPSDVLDLALRFVVENRIPFAKMALIVLPPGVLATWALGRASGWALAWAFAALFGLLAQAPFTALASRLVFERDVPVLDVLRESARRIPFLVGVRVVHLVAVVVAASFFVVPALFVLGFALFLGEVLLLERASVSAALTRLQRLSAGAAGDSVLAVLVLTTLHAAATVLGDVVGRAIVADLLAFDPPAAAWESGMGSAFAAAGFWAFLPYAATARLFFYLNVRTRAEGWDVQTRFSAIAGRARGDDDTSNPSKEAA